MQNLKDLERSIVHSSFEGYDRDFRQKYARLISDYPYAFLLLEKDLRLLYLGLGRHSKKSLGELAVFNFKKFCYRRIAEIIVNRVGRQRQTYVVLPSFPLLAKKIKQAGKNAKDQAPFSLTEGDSVVLHQVNWFALALQSTRITAFFARVRDFGIDAITDEHWGDVNIIVDKEIDRLGTLMRKAGLRQIICQGDQTARARVVCEAARRVGVEYTVIAHGYIKNPDLATYAPIYANRLFVWSQQQAEFVRAQVFDSTQRGKVYFGGSPLPSELDIEPGLRPIKVSGKKCCLIALSPVSEHISQRDRYLSIFASYVAKACDAGYEIIIRPHPKDLGLIRDWKIFRSHEISCGDLNYDILRSEFVLVSRSTVAYNAIKLGRVALQIDNLDKEEIEGAVRMNLETFKEFLSDAYSARVSVEENRPVLDSDLAMLAERVVQLG